MHGSEWPDAHAGEQLFSMEQVGEAMTEIEKTLGSASIIRPRLARWLRVSERDVLRWMFWMDYGKDGLDEERLAEYLDV